MGTLCAYLQSLSTIKSHVGIDWSPLNAFAWMLEENRELTRSLDPDISDYIYHELMSEYENKSITEIRFTKIINKYGFVHYDFLIDVLNMFRTDEGYPLVQDAISKFLNT